MLKGDDSKATIEDLSMEGVSRGNFNQDLTAALTVLSSHFKYFFVVKVNTNW